MNPIGKSEMRRAVEAHAAGAIEFTSNRTATAELGSLAKMIAAEPTPPAISQVVLAGAVRLAELISLMLLGAGIYWLYVHPTNPWHYFWAIATISSAAALAFQWAELYDAPMMRTRVQQLSRITLVWSLVFLLALSVSFFAKLDVMYSRVWAGVWYGGGLMMLFAEPSRGFDTRTPLDQAGPPDPADCDCRRRAIGRGACGIPSRTTRFRSSDLRHFR